MADCTLSTVQPDLLKWDVEVFNEESNQIEVQMHGVQYTALIESKDRWQYAQETWMRDAMYGIEPSQMATMSAKGGAFERLLTRIAFFYLRKLRDQIKASELMLMSKHRKHMKWI
jgi:hypothetical protein